MNNAALLRRMCACAKLVLAGTAAAQQDMPIESVVISANRMEQRRFDAAASIDVVNVDPLRAQSPLVNLSELLPAVPGIQVRERQNYAQDLQLSVRGFGTRSTFGVRGVRILIDGIPATMPDGQGQPATATLNSIRRIEVLRGPVAQLYGNAAGGVVQIFTTDPPLAPTPATASVSAGAGSYGQHQLGVTVAGGSARVGGLLDVSHFDTDGYREHSAAERNQFNGKLLFKPSPDTTLSAVVNGYNQPLAQDPLGLTHAQFERDPRQAVGAALTFDTRKKSEQYQGGLVLEHKLGADDTLRGRIYTGTRKVFQTLAFSGSAPTSSGGVVDLDNEYHGLGLTWSHATRLNGLPLNWTVGAEADDLRQQRRGYVNSNGNSGDLRRDELDKASNMDLFGQAEWTFHPQWKATVGVRSSRVKLSIDDRYVTAASPNDSGSVEYRNTSPVLGLVWFADDDFNVYANIGRGFETPTLTEAAYRPGATGPNLSLQPSRSTQAEVGMKWRKGRHSADLAVFDSRSSDEIVPLANESGRTIFQNVDQVRRRGMELSLKTGHGRFDSQLAYTLLDAKFGRGFIGGAGNVVAAGNRLPGAPMHSLFTELAYRAGGKRSLALEMRAESRVYVDDINSDAAPGYAVFNLRAGQELQWRGAKVAVFGRLDNLFDRNYSGSVIVNESNGRYFESAAGRRLFIGVRASL